MKNNKKWTIEEEKVLIAQIQKNPGNLKKAFICTTELIQRTERAIALHYYNIMLKNKSKLPKSYMYMTISKDKALVNKKVAKEIDYIEVKPNLWDKIKKLFGFN